MSSGFIIGQDVATLHSSRESNQLRNSNDREYMEEKAEQGDLIICSINYCVPDIFLKPSKSFQPIKCFLFPLGSSWTMTLVSNLTIRCPQMSFVVSAGSLSVSANVG